MLCPEHSRLLKHYEVALRRSAQIEWNEPDWSARIKKKRALDDRDATREQLTLHERTCPTCIHNQRNPQLIE
jgi:hypothetical protein